MSYSVSRRSFIKAATITSLASGPLLSEVKSMENSQLLFVGTQTGPASKGIYAFHFDAETGELKGLGLAAESDNPTFLALSPNGKYLYAANDLTSFQGTASGSVSAFSMDRAEAKLKLINVVSAHGTGACHLTADHTGRVVICANYAGGSAASFHVDTTGRLSEAVWHETYKGHGPNAERQEMPHAHRATLSPDNRFAFINDLGLDCIHIYRLDSATGKLAANDPAQWRSAPGAGPRALRFHPNGKVAYCVTEMASTIEVLAWDAKKGSLTTIQSTKLLPPDFHGDPTGCDIVLDRAGRFAYVAERGYDHILAYSIDPATGKLSSLGTTASGGKIPRHFTLDPTEDWVLIANQESDNITVFRRNSKTGELAKTGDSYPLVKPQCIVFV